MPITELKDFYGRLIGVDEIGWYVMESGNPSSKKWIDFGFLQKLPTTKEEAQTRILALQRNEENREYDADTARELNRQRVEAITEISSECTKKMQECMGQTCHLAWEMLYAAINSSRAPPDHFKTEGGRRRRRRTRRR